MVRAACIVNPVGRDGKTGRQWPDIKQMISDEGIDIETHMTERTGHAAEIANSLRDREDLDLVVAVGGDGTLHEVASGLRGSSMRVGIVPTGSGNDFARAHGIPLGDLAKAVKLLRNGVDRHVGAMRVEARPAVALPNYPSPTQQIWDGEPTEEDAIVRWAFLESDGGTTSNVSRSKTEGKAKWLRGSMKYTWLGIVSILKWKKQYAWLKVDDEVLGRTDMSGLYTAIMTETFGGGYRVAPGMRATRDSMDLIIASGMSKSQMLRIMGPLKKGTHVGKWGITQQAVQRFEIRNVDEEGNPTNIPHDPAMWVQVDGEPCLMTPATIEFHPNQIWIRGAATIPNE